MGRLWSEDAEVVAWAVSPEKMAKISIPPRVAPSTPTPTKRVPRHPPPIARPSPAYRHRHRHRRILVSAAM